MWTCELCGREFKNKNQSHSCQSVSTIDAYIAQYSPDEQKKLQELRDIINQTAPLAEEKISWNMPTFFQNRNLVHFAMHKSHIGFYVGPTAVEIFENELVGFHYNKGTIRLPINEPLPQKLIQEIVQFKVKRHGNI